jgi:SAM-dependent methyltransferase
MPSSFSAHNSAHDGGSAQHSNSADHSSSAHHSNSARMLASLASHLDLDAALLASITQDALNAAAATLVAEPSRIVDLGAGTGAGTLALAQRFRGAHVDSLDISAELLARLAATAASAGVADRVDAQLVDLDDDWRILGGVDLIWASMSLHHVRHPDRVLRQAFAALRPGGVLVVSEMTGMLGYEPEDLNSGVAGLGGRVIAALAAAGYPATAEWSRELADAGFTSVERHDRTVTAAARTPDGGRYLLGQFRAWRDRLASDLSPADLAGLDRAITELEDGTSPIVHTSGRAIWIAVRPAVPAAAQRQSAAVPFSSSSA